MKVALVHDYLIDYGGAERVLESFMEIFPKAPLFVLIYRPSLLGKFRSRFQKRKIYQSFFGFLPFSNVLISPFRFLIPFLWNRFDFSDFDLIISSSSWAMAKGLKRSDKTIEVCYLHTPPRYLYGYETSKRWDNPLFRKIVWLYSILVNHFLRIYDFKSSRKVDYFLANSKNVATRIKKFYKRDSFLLYPPVDVKRIIQKRVERKKDRYFLTGGRLVSSKNFELVIYGCQKAGVNLKIFGRGPDEKKLKKIASKINNIKIDFLGQISDDELIFYLKNASGFILAQKDEDFGITSVEAQAAGCPVIAYRGGGYKETVVAGKTGVFFDDLSPFSLARAIWEVQKARISKDLCVKYSLRFSKERFKERFMNFLKRVKKDARTT